jgi:hypothetical protein
MWNRSRVRLSGKLMVLWFGPIAQVPELGAGPSGPLRRLLLLGALKPGFGFADDYFCLGVLFWVVAGFVPKLMAVVEAGLCGSDLDLLGTECAVGKDGHALGKDFDEAAADAIDALTDFSAVEAYFAGSKDGDQRGVSVENFEIAVTGRNFDSICGLIHEDVIGSYEPDL